MGVEQKVIEIALSQVGYREKASNAYLDDFTANAGSGNYTKYARDYFAWWKNNYQGQFWCNVFVSWCFEMAYHDTRVAGYDCNCNNHAKWFKNLNRWISRNGDPQAGDVIFFYRDGGINHIGIVENVSNSTVYTVEGNSSNQVAKRNYVLSESQIAGYGRPNYALVSSSGSTSTASTPQPKVRPTYHPDHTVNNMIFDLHMSGNPLTETDEDKSAFADYWDAVLNNKGIDIENNEEDKARFLVEFRKVLDRYNAAYNGIGFSAEQKAITPKTAISGKSVDAAGIINDVIKKQETPSNLESLGRFKITHYCIENYPHNCNDGDSTYTANGERPIPYKTCAVYPEQISLGSHVMVEMRDGQLREYRANDTGGSIKENKIDLVVATHNEGLQEGTYYGNVYLIRP